MQILLKIKLNIKKFVYKILHNRPFAKNKILKEYLMYTNKELSHKKQNI